MDMIDASTTEFHNYSEPRISLACGIVNANRRPLVGQSGAAHENTEKSLLAYRADFPTNVNDEPQKRQTAALLEGNKAAKTRDKYR